MRIALLTEIPAPYRLPLFAALAREEGVELRVFFLARTDPRRGYPFPEGDLGFEWEVLPGTSLVRGSRWAMLSRAVFRRLAGFRPDLVVVGGWSQPAFWQALAYARTCRRPLVTWVESTERDARGRSVPTSLVKRAFLRGSAAFLVPGRAAAAYLRSLGVGDEQITVAPNAVDVVRFGHESGLAVSVLEGRCRIVFVGRLAPEKGLDILLRAVDGLPLELVVVGTGPEEERLRASAPENVHFLGQLDQDDVARWYASAQALVLPSLSEPWGMVLNEAAAAGLALVATDAVGAAYDLIEDGVNGFVVPARDEAALREALRRIAGDPDFVTAAGARSRELSQGFTPEAWAAAVANLARSLSN